MKSADLGCLPQREFVMDEKQRPLMLKDFLRETQLSTKRRHQHRNPKELPATMRYLLAMDSSRKSKSTHKESVMIPCKPPSSTLSALHKASEAIVKLLPFSVRSPSRRKKITSVSNKVNKFGYFIKRVASVKESNKGSISQRLSAAMRSLSRRDHRVGDEVKVRVRDIVRWRSFGDEEEMTHCNYRSSRSPPREESNTVDGTSDSCSSSRSSTCTWSESDYSSHLQSFTDSSVCYGVADALKDKTLSLNCYSVKEDEVEINNEFQKVSCSPSNENTKMNSREIKHGAISRDAQANVQEGERLDDGCTICCEIEGYGGKEQFSPVSVLDFPYEDEVVTSSFEESLANIERTKQQLLQKISRYENLAKLDPVDLEKRFSSSDYELADEDLENFTKDQPDDSEDHLNAEVENVEEYIREIMVDYLDASEKRRWGSFELLVIDVFREELSFDSETEEIELVRIAIDLIMVWLAKGNQEDEGRNLCVKEMERNGDWGKCRMNEEIAAEMEATMLCSLVDDLLIDLMD